MQAVWLENNVLSLRNDIPVPEPGRGEALVKVRLAGICGTDLALIKGYHSFNGIPGHEFVGEIVRTSERPERVGERVVGEINVACGRCAICLANMPRHCEQRTALGVLNRNGAFAEYVCLPLENLISVPATVSDDAAVFVEPLAAALEIREQVTIEPSDFVLVIGAGRLGQLIARTLALTGCNLQVVARYENQRDLLDSGNIPWIDENSIPERYYNTVVEATGSVDGFTAARRAVRPRGTIVLKSTYNEQVQIDFSSIVVDEITLVGSRCGSFGPAISLLKNSRVDPTLLIERRYTLKDARAALAHASQPGALKVLLQVAGAEYE
jgi:2-desacetyl-2-hydroxyethyl bacteriochlorophyllide A dehydrogenase